MKTKTSLLIALLFGSLLLFQCAKEATHEVLKTRLVITLRYENGDTVRGLPVRLYMANAADTTAIVQSTDSNGIVLYPDLQVATYYWLAKKDCKTNLASQTTLGKPLVEGAALYGYSVMANTSTLKLKNTDTARYKLSDSTLSLILPGDTTFTTYPKEGWHKFKLRKVYDTSFHKDTTIMNLNCGATVVLNIPF